MFNETYKKRLKKLAGINENITVGQDGIIKGLSFGDQIPGDKEYLYAVTYEIITPESSEQGDAEGRGWEVNYTKDTLENIISIGKHTYGVNEPSSSVPHTDMWWSSTSPDNNRNYFEKGEEKYYSLHIKHLDNTKLTTQEASFINKLLTSNNRLSWDDLDNIWK